MKKINPKSQPGLEALKKASPSTVNKMGYYKHGGSMPSQKLTRQQSKLLMKSGGELDQMMFTEKMRKGGDAKRLARNVETGKERKQAYKLGGGTHNTYSGK